MEVIKYMIIFGDLIMTILMILVLKKVQGNLEEEIVSYIMFFLFMANAGLIWTGVIK